jgi:hypothetical protein
MRSRRVLYFGDFNLAGDQIENHTRRILTEVLGNLNWERLALTREQVKKYHLPVKDVVDGRSHKSGESVECEAMSQGRIVEILRSKLDSLLPVPLKQLKRREDRERQRIRKYLSASKS